MIAYRLSACAAVLAAILAGSAIAKEGAPSADAAVNLATVALPVIQQGRVVNYVFLDVRLDIRPGADAAKVRDREPYFRDLLVRVGHKDPFVRPGDPVHLDEGRLRAVLAAAAPRLVGPGLVSGVEIVRQTPQHRGGFPRADNRPRSIVP